MQNQAFIFMGKSGSGKGTQAKLLQSYLEREDSRKVLYVETGQKFRDFIVKDNYSAKRVKEVLDDGKLAPAFFAVWFWAEFLVDNYTGEEHVIFDGMARKIYEAHILDAAIQFYFKTKPQVIDISVSNNWATERLLGRGRFDDNEEDIRERLDFYTKEVIPAIDFFESDKKHFDFHQINGEQTIEEVHREIVSKIFQNEN